LSKLGVIFPALKMDLWILRAIIGGKLTRRLTIVKASKGILPASAELIRRFYIKISRLLKMLLVKPVLQFCKS
jgi:hypothetical protein